MVKNIAMQGRETISESSDNNEDMYKEVEESPPTVGTRRVKRVVAGSSGSQKDLFEALKRVSSAGFYHDC